MAHLFLAYRTSEISSLFLCDTQINHSPSHLRNSESVSLLCPTPFGFNINISLHSKHLYLSFLVRLFHFNAECHFKPLSPTSQSTYVFLFTTVNLSFLSLPYPSFFPFPGLDAALSADSAIFLCLSPIKHFQKVIMPSAKHLSSFFVSPSF